MHITICGVDISFSFWFFAVVAGFVLLDKEVLALYMALPVCIHEMGHLAAMTVCRVKVRRIRFTAFSVNILKTSTASLGYGSEIAICLAGAAANLLVGLGLYLFAFQSVRVMFLLAANLAVALFNLLPIGNLDGGEVIKLLAERFSTVQLAHSLSRLASFVILVPLFAAAIFLLLARTHNVTLLITCVYLAVTIICRD